MLDYLRIMLDARLAKMDERGASAVEYGLLIAGIAALIVVVVFAFGGVIKNIFSDTCKSVGQSAAGGSGTCSTAVAHDEAADLHAGPRPLHVSGSDAPADTGLVPVAPVERRRITDPRDAPTTVRTPSRARPFEGAPTMLDYLRIMLNARLAKMDERGASAVEYGLLIAGIAALIVVVVFAFGGVHQEHLQQHLQQRRQERRRRQRPADRTHVTTMAADLTGPRPPSAVAAVWRHGAADHDDVGRTCAIAPGSRGC